jgi:inorganic pyrophosphatase
MPMDPAFPVYIEIEKGGLIKYEYDKKAGKLVVDRVMPASHPYPFAYGFFPGTLGSDGDELDALILHTRGDIKNNTTYNAYIIGALVMEDEHGMDEKVLCVLGEDYGLMGDIDILSEDIKKTIEAFFSTYKLNIPGKWSKTYGYIGKQKAYNLYIDALLRASAAT